MTQFFNIISARYAGAEAECRRRQGNQSMSAKAKSVHSRQGTTLRTALLNWHVAVSCWRISILRRLLSFFTFSPTLQLHLEFKGTHGIPLAYHLPKTQILSFKGPHSGEVVKYVHYGGKFIQDTTFHILSELVVFCRTYDKTLWFTFETRCWNFHETRHLSFTQYVKALFRWSWKRLHYFVANLFRALGYPSPPTDNLWAMMIVWR